MTGTPESAIPAVSDTHKPKIMTLDAYKAFRDYIQHEDDLIHNRMSWVLSIHGFLYATFGLSVQKKLEIAQKIASDLYSNPKLLEKTGYSYTHPVPVLNDSMGEMNWLLFGIPFVGLGISIAGLISIGAAQNASNALQAIFFKEFSPKAEKFDGNKYYISSISHAGAVFRLPVIVGGGNTRNPYKAFLGPKGIPTFMMLSWIFSLIYLLYCFQIFPYSLINYIYFNVIK